MDFYFTIYGNHLGLDNNPVPYHTAPMNKKLVLKKGFTGVTIYGYQQAMNFLHDWFNVVYMPNLDDQVKKYNAYTDHVRLSLAEYLIKVPETRLKYREQINILLATNKLKTKKDGKIYLFPDKQVFWHLSMIYFKNDSRGDAENINKGIVDAIHANDKYVQGAFCFAFDKAAPRVEVLITDYWIKFISAQSKFYRDNYSRP